MQGERRPHLRALTGLRFLAAFQVLAYHMLPLPATTPGWLRALVGNGYVGVGLFFVLSGFVLTYTYHDALRDGTATRRDFLVARVARLYPVYLLALLFALPPLFWLLARKGSAFDPWWLARILGVNAGLLQAWNPRMACVVNCPAWSLSAEVFFYAAFLLVLPVMARWGVRRLLVAAACAWALSLVAPVLYLALRPDGAAPATPHAFGTWLYVVKFNPLLRFPEFLIGVAAGRLFLLERRARPRLHAVVEVAAAALVAGVLVAGGRIPFLLLHNGLLAPAFALLVYALARGAGPVSRVLSTSALTRLGEASFALYILHIPLAAWMARAYPALGVRTPAQPWSFAIYASVGVGLSLLVFRWVEEPARRALRRRLSAPRRSRGAVEAAGPEVAQAA
jgi:peptidoglycan/LPS O-acetylase OafA/YrhL